MWNRLKAEAEEELKGKVAKPIKITLPDGKEIDGQSWRTTPYEVACGIRYPFCTIYLSLYLPF